MQADDVVPSLRVESWYLGFTKGPPVECALGSSISISPCVTTDLRETSYIPHDAAGLKLVYRWYYVQSQGSGKTALRLVKNAGSSEWHSANSAYASVALTVPSAAELARLQLAGETTLRLSVEADRKIAPNPEPAKQLAVDLDQYGASSEEQTFFVAALSDPIRLLSPKQAATGSASAKRSHNTTRLVTSYSGGWTVWIAEDSGYELDKHVWDASYLLSAYLKTELSSTISKLGWQHAGDGERPGAYTAIELGSGTGASAITLAHILSASASQRKAKILATDLPSAIPILERNIESNAVSSPSVRIEATPLDWTASEDERRQLIQAHLFEARDRRPDLVLIADCTYNPEYFEPLCSTIKALRPRACLLAKKHRHVGEDELCDVLKAKGMRAILLQGENPAANESYEGFALYSIETHDPNDAR